MPIPEPLRFLEPRATEDAEDACARGVRADACQALRGHRQHGRIATTYAYPVKVEGRYVMDPSPTPKFDNPKMHMSPALQLFGAGREKRIYAVPPFTEVVSLDFEDHPFEVQSFDKPCALCGAEQVYLDEVILDDRGGHCSSAPTRIIARSGVKDGHIGEMSGHPPRKGTERRRHADEPLLRVSSLSNLRLADRLRGHFLRFVARRGSGRGGRIRLWQDDASQLLSTRLMPIRHGGVTHARRLIRDSIA